MGFGDMLKRKLGLDDESMRRSQEEHRRYMEGMERLQEQTRLNTEATIAEMETRAQEGNTNRADAKIIEAREVLGEELRAGIEAINRVSMVPKYQDYEERDREFYLEMGRKGIISDIDLVERQFYISLKKLLGQIAIYSPEGAESVRDEFQAMQDELATCAKTKKIGLGIEGEEK